MFTPPQIRTFMAARDACVAVKPAQAFAEQLAAKFPEFRDKVNELNAVTDYTETLAALALAAVGQ